MDLVRELRLRQWARQHYVPVEKRQAGWHPIVLEEMQLRDLEAAKANLSSESQTGDAASEVIAATPELNNEATIPDESTEQKSEIDFAQQPWGWTFAPIELGRNRILHAGTPNVPRPHARAFFGDLPVYDDASYLFVMD